MAMLLMKISADNTRASTCNIPSLYNDRFSKLLVDAQASQALLKQPQGKGTTTNAVSKLAASWLPGLLSN